MALLIVVCVSLGLIVGFGFLIENIFHRLEYPKLAVQFKNIYFSILIAVPFIMILYTIARPDDENFTKEEIMELVQEQGFTLEDSFEIIKQHKSYGIGDQFETFTIKISEKDKNNAIRLITNSKNFKYKNPNNSERLYMSKNKYYGPKIIRNSESQYGFTREYFEPSGLSGLAPTYRSIFISNKTNELTFSDIDE